MSGNIWTSESSRAMHQRRRSAGTFRNINDPMRGQPEVQRHQTRRQRQRGPTDVERIAAATSRPSRQIYGVQPGDSSTFDIDRITDHENLAIVWRHLRSTGGQSAGTDGMTFDMSASEYNRLLRNSSEAIRQRRYRPAATRRVRILKSSGGHRTLEIPTIIDRVVGASLAEAIRQLMLERLPRHYGTGASCHSILARITVMAEDHGWYLLAVDDIRDFYPSIPRSLAMECCMRDADRWGVSGLTLVQQGIPWLMRQLIYGNEGESRAIGLTQGSTFSPLAAAITLMNVLDLAMDRQIENRMMLYRYSDNIHVQGPHRSEVSSVMEEIRSTLYQHGMQLKESGTVTRDVRQPTTQTILGVQTVWRNDRLLFAIPQNAWSRLTEKVCECLTGNGPERARATVYGFIRAYRLAFGVQADSAVDRIYSLMRRQGIYTIPRQTISQWIAEARSMWQMELSRTRSPQESQPTQPEHDSLGLWETGIPEERAPWGAD